MPPPSVPVELPPQGLCLFSSMPGTDLLSQYQISGTFLAGGIYPLLISKIFMCSLVFKFIIKVMRRGSFTLCGELACLKSNGFSSVSAFGLCFVGHRCSFVFVSLDGSALLQRVGLLSPFCLTGQLCPLDCLPVLRLLL